MQSPMGSSSFHWMWRVFRHNLNSFMKVPEGLELTAAISIRVSAQEQAQRSLREHGSWLRQEEILAGQGQAVLTYPGEIYSNYDVSNRKTEYLSVTTNVVSSEEK